MKKNILFLLFSIAVLTATFQQKSLQACERCVMAGIEFEKHQAGQETLIPLIADHITIQDQIRDELHFFESRDVVIRYAEIRIDERMRGSGWVRENDHISLNLFEDNAFEAHVQRAKVNVNGTFTITAVLPDDEGYMVLATTGSRSLGHIFLPGQQKFYKIISDPKTYQHYLIEMDQKDRDILESSPPLIPEHIDEKDIQERERIRNQLKEDDLGPEDVANIGVMVVYTPQAADWAQGSSGGIENVVAIAMANAQLVLDNSETLMVATLVHSEMVNYQESGSSNVDLRRLTAAPHYNPFGNEFSGYMEEVHFWRNQHSADLTAIFSYADDTGGLAWLLVDRFGDPNLAFSMTRVQQAATGYTHIHEMGHNMGLHHHAEQNVQPGPTVWMNWPDNTWSAGWRWMGNDTSRYVSVMSYAGGQFYADGQNATQVPYFSNPNVTYQGGMTGNPQFADNARTLLDIKHVIANYRPSPHSGIITLNASNVSTTTAVSGGVIEDLGELTVSRRGVVWNREGSPTINNNDGMTSDGEGLGEFSSLLEGLHPSTFYHVRAYAQTEEGVKYGTHNMFATSMAYQPFVSTTQAEEVSLSRAVAGGNILFDGDVPIIQKGIVWSRDPNPDTNNHEGITNEGSGDGPFSTTITGLKPETEYFFRAYATNIMGTSYGSQMSLETTGPRIYPNPSAHELWVDFKKEVEQRVYVVLANLQGQSILRQPVDDLGEVSVYFNTSSLRGGMYLVYVERDPTFPVMLLMIARES